MATWWLYNCPRCFFDCDHDIKVDDGPIRTLAANLAMAAGLCAAFWQGVDSSDMCVYGWEPNAGGRPAPCWGGEG